MKVLESRRLPEARPSMSGGHSQIVHARYPQIMGRSLAVDPPRRLGVGGASCSAPGSCIQRNMSGPVPGRSQLARGQPCQATNRHRLPRRPQPRRQLNGSRRTLRRHLEILATSLQSNQPKKSTPAPTTVTSQSMSTRSARRRSPLSASLKSRLEKNHPPPP